MALRKGSKDGFTSPRGVNVNFWKKDQIAKNWCNNYARKNQRVGPVVQSSRARRRRSWRWAMPRPRHTDCQVNDTQKMTLNLGANDHGAETCNLNANCHSTEVKVCFLKGCCQGHIYKNISKKRLENKKKLAPRAVPHSTERDAWKATYVSTRRHGACAGCLQDAYTAPHPVLGHAARG
jgi:hypothetical protein